MRILLVIGAALAGGAVFEIKGLLLGAIIGYLLAEVLILKKRVAHLEQQAATATAPLEEHVVFTPDEGADVAVTATAYRHDEGTAAPKDEGSVESAVYGAPGPDFHHEPNSEAASALDRLFAAMGQSGQQVGGWIRRFVTGGNPVLKAGLIVLFFGVAFLVKYAAQRNLVPIELRLAGAALGGLSLLGLGWRLRGRAAGYGLGLQGGGVGILYLVVYGAAKLYGLVPVGLSFGLMVALVALSGALAVLQNGRTLAVFGVVGGFLAPVLMSTGSGSHVMLFSYYALLNMGILGIAWYKAWRELNLLGFFFTFGIATLWGSHGYQPQHFASTEPFLVLYFLFYITISVLFAYRQPVNLRGFIDGPLVFGLPLIVTGLQYALVKDFRYGMAISACSLGIFYLLLATFLWRRLADGMRMLCEAFLALGVMFATLTIPLAFDSGWTSTAWALEGGAMVWVGVRQQRLLARIFGILLQLGAAWMFLDDVFYPFGATAFLNRYFFGCSFLAAAAVFSSYALYRHPEQLCRWEKFLALPLLVWGYCWWYFGGVRECDLHFRHIRFHDGVLLFGSATTMLMTILAIRISWRQLAVAQAVHLVVMVLALAAGMIDMPAGSHLFAGWGLLAWTVALYCQYRMLQSFDTVWPERLMGYWHAGTMWLLLLLACLEMTWLTDVALNLSEIWGIASWGVLPAGMVLALIALGDRPSWPLARWARYYRGIGIGAPVLLLMVWSGYCLTESGDPAPLPFIPLINPLELTLLFVIMVLLKWVGSCGKGACYVLPIFAGKIRALYLPVAMLVFLLTNGAVARSVHYFGNIPYQPESLYHSMVFQAAIAALWSLGALSMTVWAARAGNRFAWCCGAVLLGLVVVKLFVVDLSGTGTVARIVSFIVVGILMLIIGYFSPIPPVKKENTA